jgi:anti-sigma factor RsiW
MSDAPSYRSELQAYADGRLEAKRRMAVEAWLATRPEEAERIATIASSPRSCARIYDPVLAETLPDRASAQAASMEALRTCAAGWMLLGS